MLQNNSLNDMRIANLLVCLSKSQFDLADLDASAHSTAHALTQLSEPQVR